MKKPIKNSPLLILMIVIVLMGGLNPCKAQKAKTLVDLELKGEVKTIILSSYKALIQKGEMVPGDFNGRHYMEFDEAGFMVLEEQTRPDGSLMKIEYRTGGLPRLQTQYGSEKNLLYSKKFVYDEQGNRIEEADYDADSNLVSRIINAFDSHNLKVKEEFYGRDGEIRDCTIFDYNPDGKLMEEKYYFDAGDEFEKTTYTYDDLGRKTAENRYDSEGVHSYRTLYSYNDKGNLIEEKNDLNLGYQGRYEVTVYIYDSKDRKIEKSKRTLDGKLYESTQFSYDGESDRLKEETWYDDQGEITLKKSKEYDDKGQLVKEIRENRKIDQTEIYDYQLDHQANPKRILLVVDDEPVTLSLSEITYY